jgi:ArsR family transcriptional regulator
VIDSEVNNINHMAKATMRKEKLSDAALVMVANRFRLLAEPTRLKILQTLGTAEMNVSELVETTGSGQPNISKHLGALLEAGVVERRKEGLNAYYRVADESIFELCDSVCTRLKTQLETRQNALTRTL